MNQRIKELRKALKLTQDDFAAKLQLSKNYIWMVEKGDRDLGDRAARDLCRIFNVSEQWLRTGEGEMFMPRTRSDEIAEIFNRLYEAPPGDFQSELTQAIYRMTPEQIKALKDFVVDLANHLNNEK